MVAAQKWVVAKTKQTTTKKSKHNFWQNDEEESDIGKKKNDNEEDNEDDDNKEDDKDDEEEAFKKIFPENTPVAVQLQLVSDKNVTGIIDLLMDDAPKTELPGTLEAAIKNVVDTALFQGVKFYKTPKSASHIIGYVFEKIKMGGNSLENKLFCTQHWSIICKFIASRTADLQQQCIERWYAVGYGKLTVPEHPKLTTFFRMRRNR